MQENGDYIHPADAWFKSLVRGRITAACLLVVIGLLAMSFGMYFISKNPRTNSDDTVGLLIGLGSIWAIGTGLSLPFVRVWVAPLIGIAIMPFTCCLSSILFWTFAAIAG